MKNKKKLTILFAVIFMFIALSAVAADGDKKVYDKKCASCHGKDGKGNPAMAKMFKADVSFLNLVDKETQDKTDEVLISITSDGKNKMPSYKGELKGEEIKGIISYIRSLVNSH